ncbi:acyl-CoA dehydrogenase family protein [Actinocrinis puniceicyclus]|uniref:Acyl-CoA dehydrogenase family protein n=1 Tax=Actinocrinis puniceicyclus TaxID=977794 RepID=A0A8J7WPC4_9ACTN|nr:acyl-CoA dehydrogenase family protein [Actinocrinis puniceicyclus]MBS2964385.1 acyl-CoA dehydrogenase family protein [Actinocrinis puniceicyclus]
MEFEYDARTRQLREQLLAFMDEFVYPAEAQAAEQALSPSERWARPPVLDRLKAEARRRGLWNLFLPHSPRGAGLTNLQYAPLAEITGRSPFLAPEALNCSAPDTGNMELLELFGTAAQREQWLSPLLEGEIRSAFCMTEPEVASSDAANIATRIERDGDAWVVNGHKWWSSGALSPWCRLLVVLGVTDPDGEPHRRHSLLLVPADTPGVEIRRGLTVFGYDHAGHGGHAEILFRDARVPAGNLLGGPGEGFAMAQARLGPGRIHHAMRLIGMAERGLELMCRRALSRSAFGSSLAEHGVVQEWIAESRLRIEQARLLTLKTAWLMDTVGNRGARTEIQAIKIVAPAMAEWVLDRAVQAHGAAGVSQDFPLAALWAHARSLRFADGPDEVHRRSLARRELRAYSPPPLP